MTFFTIRYSIVRAVRLLLFLLLLTTACNAGENSANLPQDLDNEPVVGGNASDGTKSSDDDEISEATKEFPTATPTTPTPEVVVVDLLDGLDQGILGVKVTNGSNLDVEVVVQNLSEETVSVESPPGLLVADDDPVTVDLVLPGFVLEEIPADSEASGSIPAYQAKFTYPEIIADNDIELTIDYFDNPAPLPGALLSIIELDTHLGTIFQAAELTEFSSYQVVQLAVLAIASDIRTYTVGYCGAQLFYNGNIRYRDTWYWLDCEAFAVQPGTRSLESGWTTEAIEVREILRRSALLNEELASPFRIAFKSSNPAFSNEQLASALVALVDQDLIIEKFGFGAAFHLLTEDVPPEDGIADLPEITTNGMSATDAQRIISEWIDANGELAFSVLVESGDPFLTLIQLVIENWYTAGVSTEIRIYEMDSYYSKYMTGQFEDVAVEHRWGVFP